MSPRPYRSDRRRANLEETRRRIVLATVDLHAERGVAATTYAMIAERADVATPTVYNHFPSRADLLAACTGHVAALAPRLGPEIFDGVADLEARLRALARALADAHAHAAPWRRWAVAEASVVPELAALLERAREQRRQLVALALEPGFGKRAPAALVALCDVLLDFPAWQRLTSEPRVSPEAARSLLGDALVALVRERRLAAPRPHAQAARRQTVGTEKSKRRSA
jgi:AcrR family transcriptional regulator